MKIHLSRLKMTNSNYVGFEKIGSEAFDNVINSIRYKNKHLMDKFKEIAISGFKPMSLGVGLSTDDSYSTLDSIGE